MKRAVLAAFLVALTMVPRALSAHIGSPNVFLDAQAGPYRAFVTVRPPRAIPGVADVEILVPSGDVQDVRIVPLPLTGPGAQFAPTPDRASQSKDDPRLFTGQLWMMTAGAWQVRVTLAGALGSGVVSVPVPTLPQATLEMSPFLRLLLTGLMILLCAGFVSIIAALWREAALEPGQPLDLRARVRGRIAAVCATILVVAVVVLGNRWWSAEASSYARYVYQPLQLSTSLGDDRRLRLVLRDPGWISLRRIDDLVSDHGHLVHLFIVTPALDRFWHLHPSEVGNATFEQQLPDGVRGEYELFADVVHASGISETVIGKINVAADGRGASLVGDDSGWSQPTSGAASDTAQLADGGRMTWLGRAKPIRSGELTLFTFRVEDAAGQPATDLELYMGMPGHAIFVARDRQVFAHVHPSGSAPMAALEIGRRSLAGVENAQEPSHLHDRPTLPAEVTFPFGLPRPGEYRIFVQVKRSGRIDTAAFDVRVPM